MVIPGFNTRETAVIIWTAIFFAWMLTKADVRRAALNVFKTIFGTRFLTVTLMSAVLYAAACPFILKALHFWHGEMVKIAAFWFVVTGIGAVFNINDTKPHYFCRLLRQNFAIAAVIEFLANLYTFPLAAEVAIVPLIALLTGTQVVGQHHKEYQRTGKLVMGCLALLGFAIFGYSIAETARHFREVAIPATLEDFLLPLILTSWFVPYIYVLRYTVVMQSMLHMIHYALRNDESLFFLARRMIISNCRASLARATFMQRNFQGQFWAVQSRKDVLNIGESFRKAWATRNRQSP